MVLLVESDGYLSIRAHLLNSINMPHVLYFIRELICMFDVTQWKLCDWMTICESQFSSVSPPTPAFSCHWWSQAHAALPVVWGHFISGCTLVQQWDWNMGKNIGELAQPIDTPVGVRAWGAGSCHIAMVIKCPSLCTSNIHMSETSDSSGSGSFKASFVTVTKLAFERVSMAECIMGSHKSSMFGITNIFCGRTSTVQSKLWFAIVISAINS